ncbi:hypothetical protein DFR30_2675 [Thiogranum longum]|uniref:Uncharacterized protein n=1 Tax=Thiogranum longum TaxID=1537524 RepID=A0A4R1HG45_9GAMM|nr:hypothetical protein [Thiogranum longum]TCK19365.1 hypothetical protein DFR30_2675 [Thiogranum longum]
MIRLKKAHMGWGSACFDEQLKKEIEQVDASQLPLQAGLSQSSYVSDEPFRVMVIGTTETESHIQVRAGIFYSGIIAGCSCADDPTPVEAQTEYCEVMFDINKKSGEATVALAED